MTPAIELAKQQNINHTVHSYSHDPSSTSYGDEAARLLDVEPDRIFKTLVVELISGELAVAVVSVTNNLNLKAIAKAANTKKAVMADKQKVQRSTGYVLGGVSPLGQKRQLTTIIDASAQSFSSIYVSAGKRGLEIELSPNDLAVLTQGEFANIGVA